MDRPDAQYRSRKFGQDISPARDSANLNLLIGPRHSGSPPSERRSKSIRRPLFINCSPQSSQEIANLPGLSGKSDVSLLIAAMASWGTSAPVFRSFAPRLSKEFFTCRQCLQNRSFATRPLQRRITSVPLFARGNGRISSLLPGLKKKNGFFTSIKSLSTATASAEQAAGKAKANFPEVSDKVVAYWLLGSAASVFGIVVFGGLTRLTESGYVLHVGQPDGQD